MDSASFDGNVLSVGGTFRQSDTRAGLYDSPLSEYRDWRFRFSDGAVLESRGGNQPNLDVTGEKEKFFDLLTSLTGFSLELHVENGEVVYACLGS